MPLPPAQPPGSATGCGPARSTPAALKSQSSRRHTTRDET
jgi:hypothetical protein